MAKLKIINFVLDQTGSMMPVKDETIVGFNEYVKTIKESDKKVLFSLTLFNSKEIDERYVAAPINKVADLTAETYLPSHWTPLYDAIARTINATDDFVKGHAKGKNKVTVLCVIMTDGLENASKEYTRQGIFDLIKQKESEGWTFVYMGANQDAWEVGRKMGMSKGNTLTYDPQAMPQTFSRAGGAAAAYLANDARPTKTFWDDAEKKDKTTQWLKND